MATDLGDPHETRSFLVPAYEFYAGSRARNFDPDRHTAIGPVNGPDDIYGLIHRDDLFFRPRASSNFLFNASALFNPSVGQNDRPFSIRLQDSPAEKPAGVRSNCLTVEGRRISPRREEGRTELVPSYAAWQMTQAKEPLWISRTANSHCEGEARRVATKTVSAHWSGQGALCAVAPGRVTHLLLVEFHVYDNDADKPDLLKVWASRHTLSVGDAPARGPTGEPIDRDWKHLILRARRGYDDECGP